MNRPPPRRKGGSRRWGKLSKEVARGQICWLRFPCCTIRATGADHYWPVKYRPDLEYIRSNLRPACHQCNVTRGATLPADIPKLRAQLEAKARTRPQPRAMGFFG